MRGELAAYRAVFAHRENGLDHVVEDVGHLALCGHHLCGSRRNSLLQIGLPRGKRAHLAMTFEDAHHQHDVFEDHPEGVLEESPPLGIGGAVDRLRPEQAAEQMIAGHDDGRADQQLPVAIERRNASDPKT
jgi:hypothetical protein